jgi:hypothetical protein
MLNNELSQSLCEKWEPLLEGIADDSIRQTTAVLLENQAKSILTESARETGTLEEATTVGNLGTFQKFAFRISDFLSGLQPRW